MFGLVAIIFLVLIVFSILFIIRSFRNFKIFNKINNKYLTSLISIIPIVIMYLLFGMVNTVVIIFHLFIFLLISNLIVYLIEKINKKKFKFYLSGILAIVFTCAYLLMGVYNCYHISRTDYEVITNKNIGKNDFKIIQISDTHVGTTFDGEEFKKQIENISKIDSDIVVITGDFVDDATKKNDMIKSCEALSLLKPKYGVYFVYGNHDQGYYNSREFNKDDLISELSKNNVQVLVDEVVSINDYFYLIGRNDKQYVRKTIDELVNDLDKSKFIIDLNHQPNDYENEKDKVDLVLSGHSHGGQMFPLGYIGKISGANNEFYGIHKKGNTTFIVNSGMSNWELMFKTGTHSEYVVINIVGEDAINE